MSGKRKAVFSIAALVFSTSLGLIGLEGLTRLFESRKRYTKGTDVQWTKRTRPKNLQGYRDFRFRTEKRPNEFRIAALGDSFTWGMGVMSIHAYPACMEHALRFHPSKKRFEVMNWGMMSRNTEEELWVLEHDIVRFNPDLITLGFCLNDPEPTDRKLRGKMRDGLIIRKPKGLGKDLYKDSSLFRLVYDSLENRRQHRAFREHYDRLYDKDGERWRVCRASLERMAILCRERSIPFVVVIFPIFNGPLDDRYPYRKHHEAVSEVCNEFEIPCLDLLESYRDLDPSRLAAIPFCDPHPTEIAHRIAAAEILGFLDRLGYLPGGPGVAASTYGVF